MQTRETNVGERKWKGRKERKSTGGGVGWERKRGWQPGQPPLWISLSLCFLYRRLVLSLSKYPSLNLRPVTLSLRRRSKQRQALVPIIRDTMWVINNKAHEGRKVSSLSLHLRCFFISLFLVISLFVRFLLHLGYLDEFADRQGERSKSAREGGERNVAFPVNELGKPVGFSHFLFSLAC